MTTEKKDEAKTPDEQYDEAWNEGEEKKPDPKPEDEAEKEKEGEAIPKPGDDMTQLPAAEKKEEQPQQVPPSPPKPLEGVEKALHDTKAYATRLADENAKLRKTLDGAKSEAAIAAAKESQKKAETDLRKSLDEAYKDYPELKDALDTITGQLKSVTEKLSAREQADEAAERSRTERDVIRTTFERDVKPEVVRIHPDFDVIVKDPQGDFFKWAEKQSPAIKAAVFDSMIPSDINWAVGEYKKARSSGDIAAMRAKEEAKKENNINLAHGLKGGPSGIPSSVKKDDKSSYDDGWEAAGKILEKQGVR